MKRLNEMLVRRPRNVGIVFICDNHPLEKLEIEVGDAVYCHTEGENNCLSVKITAINESGLIGRVLDMGLSLDIDSEVSFSEDYVFGCLKLDYNDNVRIR